ncbi:type II secretion system protein, partial [Massilia eburnea]
MRKKHERGISLIGLIIVIAILGCVGLVAAQVLPT